MKNNDNNVSAAVRLLSLGVVDEEVAGALLQQAFVMAAQAANAGNLKDYRAAIGIVMDVARLEQVERHKIMDKVLPDQAMLTINGQPASPEQLWQTMFNDKAKQALIANDPSVK